MNAQVKRVNFALRRGQLTQNFRTQLGVLCALHRVATDPLKTLKKSVPFGLFLWFLRVKKIGAVETLLKLALS